MIIIGVGEYLKTRNPEVQVVLADPQVRNLATTNLTFVNPTTYVELFCIRILAVPSLQGSVLYNHFTHGKLERSEGNSITEGTHTLQSNSILHTICIMLSACQKSEFHFLCIYCYVCTYRYRSRKSY